MDNAMYSNGFSITISDVEAHIFFKKSSPVCEADGSISGSKIEDVADIILNPMMLKMLNKAISETVKVHEDRYGEIALPQVEQNVSN